MTGVWPISEDPLEGICRAWLHELGEDVNREGLVDTPRRWADFWRGFMTHSDSVGDASFEAYTAGQMVVATGFEVWSLCEQHLIPFRADITIGYVPDGLVLAMGRLSRIAQNRARGLQTQERLISQIADDVQALSGSGDVAILARGEHMCMSIRGLRNAAAINTSVLRGALREDAALREQFLSLAGQRG